MKIRILAIACMAALIAALTFIGSSTTQAAPAKAHRTKVTLKVKGCTGCKIQPSQYLGGDHSWHAKKKKVRHGKVSWRIPSSHARGLTFAVVRDPHGGGENAVPLIATRYKGQKVGSKVSASESAHAKRATPCWAGTKKSKVTIKVKARHYRVSDPIPGRPKTEVRIWFAKTKKSLKPYEKLWDGFLGAQDLYPCKG